MKYFYPIWFRKWLCHIFGHFDMASRWSGDARWPTKGKVCLRCERFEPWPEPKPDPEMVKAADKAYREGNTLTTQEWRDELNSQPEGE